MKLQHFVGTGLNGSFRCEFDIPDDLCVLTGMNGSGKTTALKSIWYIVSGNIERIPPEIEFDSLELITSRFEIKIERKRIELLTPHFTRKDGRSPVLRRTLKTSVYSFHAKFDNSEITLDEVTEASLRGPEGNELDEINREIVERSNGSVFFPTFRRMEGGFSLGDDHRKQGIEDWGAKLSRILREYSSRLSVGDNLLISSVSTADIRQVLTNKQAQIAQETDKIYRHLSEEVAGATQNFESNNATENETTARATLQKIKEKVAELNVARVKLNEPFQRINGLVDKLLGKGVRVGSSLQFGSSDIVIDADRLSAGEKQVFGFICYNALYNDIIYFIDEPEISLHADWQRILLDVLREQNPSNQFIVTTHSPLIYSRYPDKEVVVGS